MKRETSVVPVVENPLRAAAAGQVEVARDQISDDLHILRVEQRLEIDRGQIAALLGEIAALVEHVGDAAAHAGGEIAAAGAEHEHQAVGHVLAAVVADAFDDRGRAGVANREALAGDAVEERFAAGRAVESNVADQDIFFRSKAGSARRIDDDAAAGEAFADVVVGLAFERERDALGEKRAEALSGRAGELNADRVVGQSGGAVAARDLAAQHGADGAMHVANRQT